MRLYKHKYQVAAEKRREKNERRTRRLIEIIWRIERDSASAKNIKEVGEKERRGEMYRTRTKCTVHTVINSRKKHGTNEKSIVDSMLIHTHQHIHSLHIYT